MPLVEILEALRGDDGDVSTVLVDGDGNAVASAGAALEDVATVAQIHLRQLSRVATGWVGAAPEQVIVDGRDASLRLRPVADEYLLVVSIPPGALARDWEGEIDRAERDLCREIVS